MIIEVIHICIHLQSHPFKEIHSYYWLFLKILSSHWLRRVDFFKWITLKVDANVNYFYLSFYWVHAFFLKIYHFQPYPSCQLFGASIL